MKICLYSPYFPNHFGGGEKHFLDVAQILATKYQVSIAITPDEDKSFDPDKIKAAYQDFFQIDLSKVSIITTPLRTSAPWWQKLLWTAKFDAIYYITDGSLFFSLARKNILHIQIPFTQPKSGLVERLKLANWTNKNAISEFSRQVLEKAWKTKIHDVHWPMIEAPTDVTLEQLQTGKEKIIINVGRFFRQLHTKRQDALVSIFQNLRQKYPDQLKGWKLIMIGGVEDEAYAEEVHSLAKGLPIEFYHTLNREELLAYYRKAAIYWHAAGFEIDQTVNPEKVEHFGITTVEAMAHAVAPVVVGKGGQVEVMGPELQKWLWQTAEECLELTYSLISQPELLHQTQQIAWQRATAFNREAFSQTLWRMIGS